MGTEIEVNLIPDTPTLRGSDEAARSLLGQTLTLSVVGGRTLTLSVVGGRTLGTARVLASRYVPGEGLYVTFEVGDDTVIGAGLT